MATKKFKGYVSDDPIIIELESPEGDTTTFKCRRAVAGSMILDFLSDASDNDPASMARAVFGLLQAAVEPSEWDGFREFVDNPDNGVSLEVLSEMAGWISEQYAARPTGPQSPSTAGY